MLWQALSAARDLGRLQEIGAVLIRYGFGDVVRRMGMADALERAGHVLRWDNPADLAHMPPPTRVRRALEDLGPTFVKLAQVLATRVDLFEPEWIAEFGKLQDHAPPVPYEDVRDQLIEDLGAPPEEVFATFDTTVLAAASIAQVYRATLRDGSVVAVKVRRPGIVPVIEADLRLLGKLAEIAESENAELRSFRPREVVRQFVLSLRRELDLATESRNAERMAANFATYLDVDAFPSPTTAELPPGMKAPEPIPPIVIPRIHWDWVTERLCVQDLIDGIPANRLETAEQAGLDRKLLARRGARAVLKMVIEDGFYHADPHPGNVFYLDDNRIAFIDFGMMGRLTDTRREQLVTLMAGLVRDQPHQVLEILLDWTGDRGIDEEALMLDIQTFIDQYRDVPLKRLSLAGMLTELVALLRQHKLALPADLALLIKAFITLEGLGRLLDPDFDMVGTAQPMLEGVVRDRYAPMNLLKRGAGGISQLFALLTGLPGDVSRLIRAARRGRLEINIEVGSLKRVGNQIDRAANRLAIGVVVAALIIGSSIVLTVPGGPRLFGLPVLGLFGFGGAVIGGVWMVMSIWNTRHDE